MIDLLNTTPIEIHKLIKEKKVTCEEVVNFYIDKIEKKDHKDLNAFVCVHKKEAVASAKEVQKLFDSGVIKSNLQGVPIAIKDNIATTEGQTTASSKILEGYSSPFDATVIKKVKEAGLIIIGKTNMDEFAFGSSTETSHYGITKNPYKTDRVPGGSSGGSAVAVSSGEAPLSLGSDTGGSIRQPAAFNNLVGVKPTYGTVSRYGLLAYGSSLDQIGPFSRDAKSAKALLEVIMGKDERDSTSREFEAIKNNEKKLKIGIPKNYFMDGLQEEIKTAVYDTAKIFEAMGHEIKEFELPLIDYAVPTYLIVACAEASSNLSRYDGVKYGFRSDNVKDLENLYLKTRSEGFGTEVKRRIMLGSFVLASGYFDAYFKKALKVRRLIKNEFDKALDSLDLILTPTTPTTAFKIGDNIKDPLTMYLGDIYTTSANLTGLPAVSFGAGFDKENLPIGNQLIGSNFSDFTILKLIDDFQSKTDFHKQVGVIN